MTELCDLTGQRCGWEMGGSSGNMISDFFGRGTRMTLIGRICAGI